MFAEEQDGRELSSGTSAEQMQTNTAHFNNIHITPPGPTDVNRGGRLRGESAAGCNSPTSNTSLSLSVIVQHVGSSPSPTGPPEGSSRGSEAAGVWALREAAGTAAHISPLVQRDHRA